MWKRRSYFIYYSVVLTFWIAFSIMFFPSFFKAKPTMTRSSISYAPIEVWSYSMKLNNTTIDYVSSSAQGPNLCMVFIPSRSLVWISGDSMNPKLNKTDLDLMRKGVSDSICYESLALLNSTNQ